MNKKTGVLLVVVVVAVVLMVGCARETPTGSFPLVDDICDGDVPEDCSSQDETAGGGNGLNPAPAQANGKQ